jgi:hypothetical protein
VTRFQAAWDWFETVNESCRLFGQLGNCWADLPWEADRLPPGRLRNIEGPEFSTLRDRVREPLNDLAILFLFSVFEATVRDHVRLQVDPEIERLQHEALQQAGRDLRETLDDGSFFRVLKLVKGIDHNLAEEVNRIRKHRNWIAHGKKAGGEPAFTVGEPKEVYGRLRAFLELLSKSVPPLADDAGSV